MRIFPDEIFLFSLRKKEALKAPSDLSGPILSPVGGPVLPVLWHPRGGAGRVSDSSLAACEGVGERSPPRLHVSAAPPAASAGEEKGGGEMHLHGKYFHTHQETSRIGMIFAT